MDTGRQRQTSIYLNGLAGSRPQVPIDAVELERRARDRMSPEAFAYVAGGAGLERTRDANRRAFDRWRIGGSAWRAESDPQLHGGLRPDHVPGCCRVADIDASMIAESPG